MIPFWRRHWIRTGVEKFFPEKVVTDSDGGVWTWEREYYEHLDLNSGERRWTGGELRRLIHPDGKVDKIYPYHESYC